MNNTEFDIIISGGGLSGLLTAIGLLSENPSLKLAIIEPQPASANVQGQAPTANFDDRCLAISYGSLQLLNLWQVWPELKKTSWPIETIVTSDRGHAGKTIMRSSEYKLNAMGYVASMKNMAAAFHHRLQSLSANSSVTWLHGETITDITQESDSVSVQLGDKQLTAKLLVVAEGANSATRSLLKVPTQSQRYDQHAIIANVKVQVNHQHKKVLGIDNKQPGTSVAFERFTTSGPIAFLPIGKDSYSVVWSVEPEKVSDIMALSETEFNQQLQQAFGFGAGKILTSSLRASYPLELTKPDYIRTGRCVLIGNAAHAVHPIAGQGFNLGIRDIAVLVNMVSTELTNKQDFGSETVLNEFANKRKQDINRITGFTDLLVRGFGIEGRLAALVRTTGLMALQKVDCLQHWLAMHFMSSKKTPH